MNKNIKIISEKLSNARFGKKFISKIPDSIIKNVNTATEICRNAEMELIWNPIGFKAGATNKAVWKKLKTSSPFFSYLYEETTYKNNGKAPFQQNLLGAELEVAFKIKNELFNFNKKITKSNVKKFIIGMAPAIEIVGFRQKLKAIDCLGRMISDFGLNVSFIPGKLKKFNLKKRVVISESGFSSKKEISYVCKKTNIRTFLIGESLIKSNSIADKIRSFSKK